MRRNEWSPRCSGAAGGGLKMMMTTAEPMTTRGAHYTALLETIDHQGVAKLHAKEREHLLEAADALLFGEARGADAAHLRRSGDRSARKQRTLD